MANLRIEYKDPRGLEPRAQNPRTHSVKQIKQIETSIKQFDFLSPVLLDANNKIIAGHGRVIAAKQLGIRSTPTVRVDHLSPAEIRAYVIADNKIAENAGWDRGLLALELKELEVDFNFDVTVTGFETAEVDIIIGVANQESTDQSDIIPELDRSIPAISQHGDLWRVGKHFLLCESALSILSYQSLLGSQKAQMIFIDPPYNVTVSGRVSGKGRNKHREFLMASGEMSKSEFTEFLGTTFRYLVSYSSNGSIHFVCMDWRHMREVLDAGGQYTELKNLCVWAKTNAGMGSLFRSQHELVFVFKSGVAPHINNVELGRFGRNRSNLWTYAGVNSFGEERDAELSMHPTVKPLALVKDAILDCSRRGGIVLDVFAGSGTTLIAAEQTGRRGYGIELDPYYIDTIIRRFSLTCGIEAVHVKSQMTFDEVKTERSTKGRLTNADNKGFKAETDKRWQAEAKKRRSSR